MKEIFSWHITVYLKNKSRREKNHKKNKPFKLFQRFILSSVKKIKIFKDTRIDKNEIKNQIIDISI